MSDDLRWSWCHNNRNKVLDKCNVLESSPNHLSPPAHGRIIFHETGPRYQTGCEPLSSVSSVAQSCPALCDSMNHSMPDLPVHHQLPESTQTHVYWVSDAIHPSHPLSSPSPPALNLAQHRGLFKWVSSSHQVAKVLEFQLQHHCCPTNEHQEWYPLEWTGWISLQSKRLSRVFSNTTVQKHQFFCTQLSL